MSKKIEVLSISDPETLKQQLEQMVNVGWSIKGIGNGPNQCSETFVILERDSADDPTVNEELYIAEEPIEQPYSRPEPPHKEISISMG